MADVPDGLSLATIGVTGAYFGAWVNPAVVLALTVPIVLAVSSVMSLGSAFVPMLLGWGFAGRTMSTDRDPAAPRASVGVAH